MPSKLDDIVHQLSSIEDESNLIKETIELILELEAQNSSLRRQILDIAVELELSYKKDSK